MTATIRESIVVQAITTSYIGYTSHKPPRVAAKAQAGRIVIEWDDGMSIERNHAAAAIELANKYGWEGEMAQGAIENGYAFVFVFTARK